MGFNFDHENASEEDYEQLRKDLSGLGHNLPKDGGHGQRDPHEDEDTEADSDDEEEEGVEDEDTDDDALEHDEDGILTDQGFATLFTNFGVMIDGISNMREIIRQIKDSKAESTNDQENGYLLPLSLKNESNVPQRPRLHHIFVMAHTTSFKELINFQLDPVRMPRAVRNCSVPGVDWDGKSPKDIWMDDLKGHPMLYRAFA